MTLNLFLRTLPVFAIALCTFSASAQAPQPAANAQKESSFSVASLDNLWTQRATSKDAILAMMSANPAVPEDFEVAWRMARMAYFAGFFVVDQHNTAARIKLAELGMDAGQKARKLNPSRVEGPFWRAVNIGGRGIAKGIMASLGGAGEMRDLMEEAIKIDPAYYWAGPHRALGRLYHKLPSMISFGDNDKATMHFKEAMKLAPAARLNLIYFADLQNKTEGKDAALQTLQKARVMAPVMGTVEEARFSEELEALANEIK